MDDLIKQLTPQQLARLIQYAEGGGETTPDGATLHAEKNAPWVNGMYTSQRFPAYVFQPYPKWLYTAGWIRADEQYRNALRLRVRRGMDPDQVEQIVQDAALAREACMKLVQGAEEERLLGSLWCDSPTLAIEAQEQHDRAIAEAAAVSAYDDRLMSPAATAEREAADAASDGHLVEVARTPVKRDPRSHRKPTPPKSHHRKTVTDVIDAAAETVP
jgi:hypothetical protein